MTDSIAFEAVKSSYKQYLKWKHRLRNQIGPSGSIDTANYYRVLSNAQVDQFNQQYYHSDFDAMWREIGPGTTSRVPGWVGRLMCVKVDRQNNNIVLAGSSVGGLFYTTDNGVSWHNGGTDQLRDAVTGDRSGVIGISNIEIVNQQNQSYWFIATGDKDNDWNTTTGIYRSQDQGVTWNKISDGLQSVTWGWRIYKLLADPDNSNIMYAATDKGIYKTSNALATNPTWSQITNGLFEDKSFFDFEIITRGTVKYLYASANILIHNEPINSGRGIIYSSNGGLNWFSMPNLSTILLNQDLGQEHARISIETTIANPNFLYAWVTYKGKGDIPGAVARFDWVTTQWVTYDDPSSTDPGRQAFEVSNFNEDHIWLGYVKNNRSTNGGASFLDNHNTHDDIHEYCYNNTETVLWAATDGGIFKYENSVWSDMTNNIGVATTHDISVSMADPNEYLAGFFDDGTQIYNRASDEWTQLGGGDGYGTLIDFKRSWIYYHTNNGNFCKSGSILYNYPRNWSMLFASHPVNNLCIYFTAASGVLPNKPYNDGIYRLLINVFTEITTSITEINGSAWRMYTSANNPDYLYTYFINNTPNNKLYYTTDATAANPIWVNIPTPSFSGPIASLAVDKDEPTKFWISFGGYENPYHKVCLFDGVNFNNHTGNLSQLNPCVTAICQLNGVPGGVFIATNVGVYYKDNTLSDWVPFGTNLPHCEIMDMEINYKSGKLVIGTFGRGLWEADLPCLTGSNTEINQNELWADWRVIAGDVTIKSGKTLTIKGVVGFPENSKIIVEPNAKLIIDGGFLTNSCSNLWYGILLQGEPTENQSDVNKGVIELINGAIIQNALTAISTVEPDVFGAPIPGTGGIIRAENATFRNCQTAVQMYPFKNNGSNYASSIDQSYFRNCTFVTDDDYLLKGVTSPTHMNLDGIYQLRVEGCTFRNDETPPAPGYLYSSLNGTGIMALDASVVVTPLCTTQTVPCSGQIRNQFINLHNAIHITQPLTSQGHSTLIKEADFTGNYRAVYANSPQLLQVKQCSLVNNYRGVYLLNSQGAMVEENEVEIAEEYETTTLGYPYGLYLDAGHGFSVEGNNFSSTYPGTVSYGILVNNTGAKNNEIYRNTFSGLKVGIQPQFRNKGVVNTAHVGLCLFCNEFNNPDTWDFWVGGKSIATHKKNIGINVAQQISDGSTQLPAGNLFSSGHLLLPQNPNADNDFSNFDADYLSYAYDPSSSNGRMEPLVYSNIILFPRQSGATQCMTKTGNINNLTQGYASLASAQVALNSSRLILDIWKNGGIEDLEEQVELVLPWEVYQQYNELMSISPYVAADALIAMIQNTSFTDLMVKLVCVANPQAARNDEVLGALYNRNPPMPEQYIEEILDESGSYSPLEELESNVAADYHLVRTMGDEILRLYYADTTNLWVTDSIGEFLSRLPGLEDRYIYALHCLRTGDSVTTQSLMDEIPTQFELNDREYIEYEFMSLVFNLLDSIRENELQPGDLTPEQTETLLQMLETEGTVDKALAISVILWNDPAYEYIEPILEPAGSQLRKARPQKTVTNETIELMLYPSPAKDHFTVFYKVPDHLRNSLSIQVKDVSGRIVLKQPLPDNAFEYLFETVALTRGIYTVMLLNSTGLLKSEKLVIIK